MIVVSLRSSLSSWVSFLYGKNPQAMHIHTLMQLCRTMPQCGKCSSKRKHHKQAGLCQNKSFFHPAPPALSNGSIVRERDVATTQASCLILLFHNDQAIVLNHAKIVLMSLESSQKNLNWAYFEIMNYHVNMLEFSSIIPEWQWNFSEMNYVLNPLFDLN